jgi:hypothetical protein
VTFTTLSIADWFSTLAGEPLEEIKKVWQEIGYKHFLENQQLKSLWEQIEHGTRNFLYLTFPKYGRANNPGARRANEPPRCVSRPKSADTNLSESSPTPPKASL